MIEMNIFCQNKKKPLYLSEYGEVSSFIKRSQKKVTNEQKKMFIMSTCGKQQQGKKSE